MPNRFSHYDTHNGSAEQRSVIEEINAARGRTGRPMTPQFGMLLGAPEAARRIASLGAYCRFQTSLPDMTREVVTLSVACAKNSSYEADVHETFIKRLGASDSMIAALREQRAEELPDELRPAVALALSIAKGAVEQKVVDQAKAALGERAALDVVVTAAYYAMLAAIGAALTPDQITDPH